MNYSSVWQPMVWKMATGSTPLVLPLPGSVTIPSTNKIEVNDAGFAATTALNGLTSCTLLWHVVGNTVGSPVILPALSAGGWTSLAGISNTNPPVVGGNSVLSTGKTHAVYWNQSCQIVDLGTLGGTTSRLNLISGDGHMAGTSEVLLNNTLKYQTFIVTPHRAPAGDAILSFTKLAQGSPFAANSDNIVLKAIANSGEVMGTIRPNDNQGNPVPMLWHHGLEYPLDNALPPTSGYSLISVDALNGCGTILATAWKDGYSARLLLTPDQDTDGDGMPDNFENKYNFNPFLKNSASADSDSDGLTDIEEYRNGTNPRNADTDGDGMKDGWEVEWGLSPLDPSDASLDPDGDHVTNLRESQINTNPTGLYRIIERGLGNLEELHKAGPDGSIVTSYHTEYGINDDYYSGAMYYTLYGVEFLCDNPTEGGEWEESNYSVDSCSGEVEDRMYFTENLTSDISLGTKSCVRVRSSYSYYEGYVFPTLQTNSYTEHKLYVDPFNVNVTLNWETIEQTLRTSGHLAQGESIPFVPTLISHQGQRACHRTNTGRNIVLDDKGNFIGLLPGNAPGLGTNQSIDWKYISESGHAVSAVVVSVPSGNGILAHEETKILVWDGNAPTLIPTPSDWYPASAQPTVSEFSDDGRVVVRRPVRNPDGSTHDKYYVLEVDRKSFTKVAQNGIGADSIVCISSEHGHLMGAGPKPYRVSPDGASIRLETLRVTNSTGGNVAKLGCAYPGILVPYYIDSDGSMIVTNRNPSNQTEVLRLIPMLDSDNDGVPDDWERSVIKQLRDAGVEGISDDVSKFDVDEDHDGDGLTLREEWLQGTSDGSADNLKSILAETNGEKDLDGDGIKNADDADPYDPAVDWEKVPEPAYVIKPLPQLDLWWDYYVAQSLDSMGNICLWHFDGSDDALMLYDVDDDTIKAFPGAVRIDGQMREMTCRPSIRTGKRVEAGGPWI